MTPEQIEAQEQEWEDNIHTNPAYNTFREYTNKDYITGALSRQPELDTLQSENKKLSERYVDIMFENGELRERVRELEEGLGYIKKECSALAGSLYIKEKDLPALQEADRLLTKPDSTGGGEKEV